MALSVYGSYAPTWIPFVIGMVGVSTLLLLAIRSLPTRAINDRTLSRLLTAIALLTLGVAITPLGFSRLFYDVHITIALVLAAVNLITAIWLLIHVRRDLTNYVLLVGMIAGAAIGILSMTELGILHALASGQILAVLSFAVFLARTVAQLERVNIEDL
jgi:hypothetical protein